MKFNTFAKLFMFIFSSLAIVSSFQNCAKSKINSSASEPKSSGSTNDVAKLYDVDLSKATSLDLQLDSLYATNYRIIGEPTKLQINLMNGEMRQVNEEGHIVSPIRLCLYREELAEIKSIIDNAKVCMPEQVSGDVVCTQEYVFPYAKVQLDNNETIKLGEKSGCTKGFDLCEENKKALNGFISYLNSHIDNRKCL